jgi:hypothetical protein
MEEIEKKGAKLKAHAKALDARKVFFLGKSFLPGGTGKSGYREIS